MVVAPYSKNAPPAQFKITGCLTATRGCLHSATAGVSARRRAPANIAYRTGVILFIATR